MKYLDVLGSICMFIAILCIVAVNVIQDIEISNIEKAVNTQQQYIEEFIDTQEDMQEDIDSINDVLTGGLDMGMFTATYYCA